MLFFSGTNSNFSFILDVSHDLSGNICLHDIFIYIHSAEYSWLIPPQNLNLRAESFLSESLSHAAPLHQILGFPYVPKQTNKNQNKTHIWFYSKY